MGMDYFSLLDQGQIFKGQRRKQSQTSEHNFLKTTVPGMPINIYIKALMFRENSKSF